MADDQKAKTFIIYCGSGYSKKSILSIQSYKLINDLLVIERDGNYSEHEIYLDSDTLKIYVPMGELFYTRVK